MKPEGLSRRRRFRKPKVDAMTTLAKTTTNNVSLECWTDEDLLTEYRLTGGRELFETLAARYETELYRFLYARTGNREMAEDIFQMTFFAVHQKCALFEEGRKFRPWLYRIAVNQMIDCRRKERRHQSVSLDAERSADGQEGATLGAILEENGPSPDEMFERSEEAALLREILELLPRVQREALELVYFRGMSYRQAAAELDVPYKTVSTRLGAAKKRLADVFARRNRS